MNSFRAIKLHIYICIHLFVSCAYASPCVIAHRGGGHNFPENTLHSFAKCLEIGCDALELDVQVTKDGVVVVYHPEDLKQWTNGTGKISEQNWSEIAILDAGYHFNPGENYPFRNQNLKVPRLVEVLEMFPKALIIIDLKSLPADTLVNALIEAISDEESSRLIFYSTNSEHIELISQKKPHWKMFEKRETTRQRLLELNQAGRSELPLSSDWMGFELSRKMSVTETFALGKGTSTVEFHLWSPEVVSNLKGLNPSLSIVLFGINTKNDWEEALNLDVDGIYTDNPCGILQLRTSVQRGNEPG